MSSNSPIRNRGAIQSKWRSCALVHLPGASHSGFTLIELMVVCSLIGLLAIIAIPNFVEVRTQGQRSACINNLRQIDGAIQTWAIENHKPTTAAVDFSDIAAYLRGKVICPANGSSFPDSYALSTVSAEPVCQRVPSSHALSAGSWSRGLGGGAWSGGGSGNGGSNGGSNNGSGGKGNGNGNSNGSNNGNGNGGGNGSGGGDGGGKGNGHANGHGK